MKIKFLIFILATLAVSSAEAQFGIGRVRLGSRAESMLAGSHTQYYQYENSRPEIKTDANCTTTPTPGSDGVFARIEYCHRLNPSTANGVLQIGYDVPANFLTEYTEDDVASKWTGVTLNGPTVVGTSVDLPVELLTSLNHSAAKAWEKLLACANGNADQARELYRTGAVGCIGQSDILTLVRDIRTSLPMMAATMELPLVLNMQSLEARSRELDQQENALNNSFFVPRTAGETIDYERRYYEKMRQEEVISRQRSDISQLRLRMMTEGMGPILDSYIPNVPRMHPVLAQILIEEVVSVVDARTSAREMERQLNRDSVRRTYMAQLLAWLNSIENFRCSSLGLWPSANRTALASLGDVATEARIRALSAREAERSGPVVLMCNNRNTKLPTVYATGRTLIRSEVSALRNQYVNGARP